MTVMTYRNCWATICAEQIGTSHYISMEYMLFVKSEIASTNTAGNSRWYVAWDFITLRWTSAAAEQRRKCVTIIVEVSPGVVKANSSVTMSVWWSGRNKRLVCPMKEGLTSTHSWRRMRGNIRKKKLNRKFSNSIRKKGPDIFMHEIFAGWWSGVRNVHVVWLWVDSRTSKSRWGVVVYIALVHFDDVRKQSTDGIQSIEEENVKQAARVTIWNEKEMFLELFFCRNRWASIECIILEEILNEMTCAGLRKDNGERKAPERIAAALFTNINFMSVVMQEVQLNKCFIVSIVWNWNARLAINCAMCSGHRPKLFAPMRKSESVTWSTICCSRHFRYAWAR